MHPTFKCIHSFKKLKKSYLVWKATKTHLRRGTRLFFCFFEALLCPFWIFGVFLVPSYITVLFCFFLLVWIVFLPLNLIMHIFKVVFVNSFHIYKAFTMTTEVWCHFQPKSRYISNDQHINFGNCLFWHSYQQMSLFFDGAMVWHLIDLQSVTKYLRLTLVFI